MSPDPTPPAFATIGDAITAKLQSEADVAAKHEAAVTADEDFATAQDFDAELAETLRTDLQLVGDAYAIGADGVLRVYIVDSSAAGYHVITPAPADTPLPITPTPEPGPPG